MNNAINPAILIIIDIEYNIDSGKTKEYHPKNSPNAKSPNPTDTEIAPLFLLSQNMITLFQLHHMLTK